MGIRDRYDSGQTGGWRESEEREAVEVRRERYEERYGEARRRRKVRGKKMTGPRVGSVVREERRAAEAVRERVRQKEGVRGAVGKMGEEW